MEEKGAFILRKNFSSVPSFIKKRETFRTQVPEVWNGNNHDAH